MKVKIVTERGTFEAEGDRYEVANLYEVFGTGFSAEGCNEEIANRAAALRHGTYLFPLVLPEPEPKATGT